VPKSQNAKWHYFTFEIGNPPIGVDVDDLTGDALLAIGVFIVAEDSRGTHSLVVRSLEPSMSSEEISALLNDKFHLRARNKSM
jgi:hypothetical protein